MTNLKQIFLLLVPTIDDNTSNSEFPPGLALIENFVTEEQEKHLLRTINWEDCGKKYLLYVIKTVKLIEND